MTAGISQAACGHTVPIPVPAESWAATFRRESPKSATCRRSIKRRWLTQEDAWAASRLWALGPVRGSPWGRHLRAWGATGGQTLAACHSWRPGAGLAHHLYTPICRDRLHSCSRRTTVAWASVTFQLRDVCVQWALDLATHLYCPVPGHEQIGRLEVLVDDGGPLLVQVLHPPCLTFMQGSRTSTVQSSAVQKNDAVCSCPKGQRLPARAGTASPAPIPWGRRG